MPYRARASETLMEALERMFEGRSKKDLRRLLFDERVHVNGVVAKDPGAMLDEGDEVECLQQGRARELHPKVRLIYEDDHLLAVEKGVGILTSGGVKGRGATVVDVLEQYLSRRGIRRKIFACHRLDRDVSGVCLLAKDPRIAEEARDDASRAMKERIYVALVEGTPRSSPGTIRSYLKDDDATKLVRETSPGEGKLCITHYEVISSTPTHATLEVRLETGRKNQIRAHLASIGHPIAGDTKYGARTNPVKRVALHAARLVVKHPVTGAMLDLSSKVPWRIHVSPPPAMPGRAPPPDPGDLTPSSRARPRR